MEVSVVIVNYNVCYFLEQCLFSVRKALKGITSEIWVIDNQSTDGSVSYLQSKFPEVHFIENERNIGFSRANNQVLGHISGNFVHFLNPDTILPEDFYKVSLIFMDQHPKAGAIGPRMINGSGKYLPESKRGLPTLWSAFCKMSGIATIFPRNKHFSGYYQGNLPENQQNKVSVLSGASMFIRKSLIVKTRGFDERYFMYGEDIDLSYALLSTGFENWYVPQISILHFKGESTVKNEQYWANFYSAMLLFIQKHENGILSNIKKKILAKIIQKKLKTAQKRLKSREKPLKNGKIESNALILREGVEGATFKSIIEQISQLNGSRQCLIQAFGATSVVGSQTSEEMGIAVRLDDLSIFHSNTTP